MRDAPEENLRLGILRMTSFHTADMGSLRFSLLLREHIHPHRLE